MESSNSNIQNDQVDARTLYWFAEELQNVVLVPLTTIKNKTEAYSLKHRVKSPVRIEDKVNRKNNNRSSDQDPYYPRHITDALGVRFVVLFQQEIGNVIDELANFVANNQYNLTVGVKEAVFYTNRPSSDPLSFHRWFQQKMAKIPGVGNDADIRPPENKKSGYSSVHLVFDVNPQQIVRDDITRAGERYNLSSLAFEVQIRDIFEEAWCEIDHRMKYKDDSDESSFRIVDEYLNTLNALKIVADGCSQQASVIYEYLGYIKSSTRATIDKQNVFQPEQEKDRILDILRRNSHTDAYELVDNAFAVVKDVEANHPHLPMPIEEFKPVAQNFEEALDLCSGILNEVDSEGKTLFYHLYSEYAHFAYLSDYLDTEDIENIYRDLLERYPRDPVLSFRYGRLLTKDGNKLLEKEDVDAAKKRFEAALSYLEDASTSREEIVRQRFNGWFYPGVANQKSFLYWCIFVQTRDVSFLDRAFECVDDALKFSREFWEKYQKDEYFVDQYHKALSNKIYYILDQLAWECGKPIISLCESDIDTHRKKSVEDLQTELESEKLTEASPNKAVRTQDTLMLAAKALGKKDKARELAKENIRNLEQIAKGKAGTTSLSSVDISEHLGYHEKECYNKALSISFGNLSYAR